MFVRNTTSKNITHKVYFRYSGYGNSSNYASMALNGSNVWTYTGSTVSHTNVNVTFPANKSSLLILASGSYYWTNYGQVHWMRNWIGFYNNTWKLPSGLEWDYKRYNEWMVSK